MQITTTHLSHIYDEKTKFACEALDDISITLPDGGIIAFIGHTGSGKTSMIKHFNGLLLPTSGQLNVGEIDITPSKKKRKLNAQIRLQRQKIGMVFQFPEDQIFEETVAKELTFGIKSLKLPQTDLDNRVIEALKMVGLDESFCQRNPLSLSGGEKRRVALASTIILDQEMIILDEPTASLDNDGIKEVYSIIKKIVKEKKRQVIIVTHDLKHVLEHADYVFVFADSKVVSHGKTLEVMYDLELFKKHKLETPKLVKLTYELIKNGINIPKTKSIDEFVKEYSKLKGLNNE